MENNNANRVIKTFYTINGAYTLSASFIWGINTLFLLEAGLDIFAVFITNAIFTASMSFFEIPTGIFADTLGRRFSFLMSVLILLLGTAAYLVAFFIKGGLPWFAFASIVLGLGFTFYSGAVEAWLVDSLKAENWKGILDTVFARSGMIQSIAMLIGTVSGGLIGNLHLAYPYLIRSFLLVVLFVLAIFFMQEKGFKARSLTLATIPLEMKKVAQSSFKYGWQQQSLRLFMIFSFIQSSFMMWGFYASQPYFLKLYGNPDAVWLAGLLAALISLAMLIGNKAADILTKKLKKRTTLLISACTLQSIAIITIGLNNNFYVAVSLFLCFIFCFGLIQPLKQSFMHQMIPADKRATIISFDSLIGNGGSIFGQTGLGYISKQFSITLGYFVGGIVLIFSVPGMIKLRLKKEKADIL